MEEKELIKIETKLDILIADFQSFKIAQTKHNEARRAHAQSEDIVQASILTTQKWHTVIGGFMMTMVMYLMYNQIGGK